MDRQRNLPPSEISESEKVAATSTPIYSSNPTLDEWTFCDHLARAHITLNCTDVASLGVSTTGTAKDSWESIQTEWGKSTDMRCSHAQEALNKTEYAEETDIQDHIKMLRTRKAAVDNLSDKAMSDETWKGGHNQIYSTLSEVATGYSFPLFIAYLSRHILYSPSTWDDPQKRKSEVNVCWELVEYSSCCTIH